jgi:ABC-type cobalamin transport system ATPase subunit
VRVSVAVTTAFVLDAILSILTAQAFVSVQAQPLTPATRFEQLGQHLQQHVTASNQKVSISKNILYSLFSYASKENLDDLANHWAIEQKLRRRVNKLSYMCDCAGEFKEWRIMRSL